MGVIPMVVMAAASLYQGSQQAQNEQQAGRNEALYYKYLSGTARQNARLADVSAESQVSEVGAQEQQEMAALHAKKRETIGAQKAALVTGAGVGSKTAEQIVSDTENKTNLDEMALRYNADLKMKSIRIGAQAQAMNLENQATGYDYAGINAKKAAKIKSNATLLGTGTSTAFNLYSGMR